MSRVAIAGVLFVISALGCASRAHQESYELQPAGPDAYRLDVRTHSPRVAVGDHFEATYVLTNASDVNVKGCLSDEREWIFTGTDDTIIVQQTTGSHQICAYEDEFAIGAGDSHSWDDAVKVPDVGQGPAEVAITVHIVLTDWKRKIDSDYQWAVSKSIMIDIDNP